MDMFLFIIGFLGFIVLLVMLIIAAFKKKSKKKIAFGILACLFLMIAGLVMIPESEEGKEKTEVNDTEKNEESEIESETQSNATSTKLVPEDAIEVDYIAVWNDYSDEQYKGKTVKFTGKIDYIGEDNISIKDGLEGLTGMAHITPQNKDEIKDYSVGQMITVIGVVKQKLVGYLYVENAIISKASDSEIAMLDTYEKERKKAVVEEEKEYKSGAKSIDYDKLVREPSKYESEIIVVKIKISQIMGGGILADAGYAGKQGDNEWYISYKIPDDVPRILENDTVTFYGEFAGVEELTRALTGTKVYIPRLKAKYHEIN